MTRNHTIKISILLLTLAILLPLATAHAQEGISAALTAEVSELNVGDVIPLTLQVTHPAGYRVIPVQLEQSWGEVEVRDVSSTVVTLNPDGTETTTQTIAVTLWAPGVHSTPCCRFL